jgi:hypothetical protein
VSATALATQLNVAVSHLVFAVRQSAVDRHCTQPPAVVRLLQTKPADLHVLSDAQGTVQTFVTQ